MSFHDIIYVASKKGGTIMRQYFKQHKEIVALFVALLSAMIFQYLRIASLDIAFLFEVTAPSLFIYLLLVVLIPVIVLFFVFVPILFITEVKYKLPAINTINIRLKEVVYFISTTSTKYIKEPGKTTVLRC